MRRHPRAPFGQSRNRTAQPWATRRTSEITLLSAEGQNFGSTCPQSGSSSCQAAKNLLRLLPLRLFLLGFSLLSPFSQEGPTRRSESSKKAAARAPPSITPPNELGSKKGVLEGARAAQQHGPRTQEDVEARGTCDSQGPARALVVVGFSGSRRNHRSKTGALP